MKNEICVAILTHSSSNTAVTRHKYRRMKYEEEIYYSDCRFNFADSANDFVNESGFIRGSLKKERCPYKGGPCVGH